MADDQLPDEAGLASISSITSPGQRGVKRKAAAAAGYRRELDEIKREGKILADSQQALIGRQQALIGRLTEFIAEGHFTQGGRGSLAEFLDVEFPGEDFAAWAALADARHRKILVRVMGGLMKQAEIAVRTGLSPGAVSKLIHDKGSHGEKPSPATADDPVTDSSTEQEKVSPDPSGKLFDPLFSSPVEDVEAAQTEEIEQSVDESLYQRRYSKESTVSTVPVTEGAVGCTPPDPGTSQISEPVPQARPEPVPDRAAVTEAADPLRPVPETQAVLGTSPCGHDPAWHDRARAALVKHAELLAVLNGTMPAAPIGQGMWVVRESHVRWG